VSLSFWYTKEKENIIWSCQLGGRLNDWLRLLLSISHQKWARIFWQPVRTSRRQITERRCVKNWAKILILFLRVNVRIVNVIQSFLDYSSVQFQRALSRLITSYLAAVVLQEWGRKRNRRERNHISPVREMILTARLQGYGDSKGPVTTFCARYGFRGETWSFMMGRVGERARMSSPAGVLLSPSKLLFLGLFLPFHANGLTGIVLWFRGMWKTPTG
jgi:hypothetical protein